MEQRYIQWILQIGAFAILMIVGNLVIVVVNGASMDYWTAIITIIACFGSEAVYEHYKTSRLQNI